MGYIDHVTFLRHSLSLSFATLFGNTCFFLLNRKYCDQRKRKILKNSGWLNIFLEKKKITENYHIGFFLNKIISNYKRIRGKYTFDFTQTKYYLKGAL